MRRAQLRHRLPFRSEPYTLTLHLPPPQRQPGAEAEPHSPRQHAGNAARAGLPAGSPPAAPAGAVAAWAPVAAAAPGLQDAPHRLQTWFGLGAFLLLTPDSYSGRVLEAEVGAAVGAARAARADCRVHFGSAPAWRRTGPHVAYRN